MLNVNETIYAQFAASRRLTTLIHSADQSLDVRRAIELFFNNVVNPSTALGWGLDVWGRIVGVSRTLSIQTGRWLGFEEANDATNLLTPFNDAPFYSSDSSAGATDNYALTDEAFRKLIFAKAAANISNGSIGASNHLLMSLFGTEDKYIWVEEDVDKRSMTIVYDFELSLVDATILETSGVLPRPCGISLTYKRVNNEKQ